MYNWPQTSPWGAPYARISSRRICHLDSERPAQMAAALAYYGMFSFAPVIYIAFTIAGLFIVQLAGHGQLNEQLQKVLGPETAEQVRRLVQAISKTAPSGSILASLISFLA
jgi:uncharacterized BrkB/YihY/UPF0761 family membrane protein